MNANENIENFVVEYLDYFLRGAFSFLLLFLGGSYVFFLGGEGG